MKQTQHQKILQMCADGGWHCQNEFRALYCFSPHKRRMEIARSRHPGTGDKSAYLLTWEERPCEHGVRGQKDYKLLADPTKTLESLVAHQDHARREIPPKNIVMDIQAPLGANQAKLTFS